MRASGVTPRVRLEQESGSDPDQRVMVALPSSWARRDAEVLMRDLLLEQGNSRRAKSCSILHSIIESHSHVVNGPAVVCETEFVNGFYEYGAFIFEHDVIGICFSVADREFKNFLLRSGIVSGQGNILLLKAVIGTYRIQTEAVVGDVLGDICMQLPVESGLMREVSLRFRLGGLGSGWTSILHMSAACFLSRSARLSSVSLLFSNSSEGAPPLGVLRDGRKYIRVPYMIFTDDFSSMDGRGGSCGGCYLAPLLSSAYGQRGVESVRIIELTTPGASSNAVLRHIVEDIISCATNGMEVMEKNGEKMVLFVEMVAYVGDYSGMSHCFEVLGQNACAPCTHCIFRRADLDVEEECSLYGYTSSINSSEPSFRRTKQRMRAIRQAPGTEDNDLQYVGLKKLSDEQQSQLPLHMLSDRLEEAREWIPLTKDLKPVISGVFDPYESSIIALFHVL